MKVAVLGLGAMGLPMMQCLAEEFDASAFDVFESSRERAIAAGSQVSDTAHEAVTGADIVVIVVRDGKQVEDVLFGGNGVAESLRPGAVVVITSTVGEDTVVAMANRLAESGIGCIDAALSGGPVRARSGDLVIMVGGDEQSVAKAKPVLDCLASTLCIVGEKVGQGQQLKAVNQLLCGIHTAAAGEALAFAYKLGLDLDIVIDVLGHGAAQSFMLLDRGPRMVQRLRGEEPPLRSRLDVIGKDMGIVGDMTRASKVSTPVASAAEQLYRLAEGDGLGALDDSIITMFLSGDEGRGEK